MKFSAWPVGEGSEHVPNGRPQRKTFIRLRYEYYGIAKQRAEQRGDCYNKLTSICISEPRGETNIGAFSKAVHMCS